MDVLIDQDINQDGFGDIVVGAPGVGNDAGAAYVVFGRETFSSASLQLGSIGSDGSLILTAPSSHGFLGFSVAGTGERHLFTDNFFKDFIILFSYTLAHNVSTKRNSREGGTVIEELQHETKKTRKSDRV